MSTNKLLLYQKSNKQNPHDYLYSELFITLHNLANVCYESVKKSLTIKKTVF